MAGSGEVLEMGRLGVRVELRRTGADTGGELLEFDVVGRGRGILVQAHVHTGQVERLEVIHGAMALERDGRRQVLGEGDALEVPAGVAHRQRPHGPGSGRVRVQVRPAGDTQAFLERLAELCRDGQINRMGLPRPVAGARLVRDFGATGHAARPPVALQRAVAGTVLRLAALGRPYVFVDEWDVAAPPAAVFGALADGRTYPEWWTPVYLEVEADGPAAVGQASRQRFTGRLPYHLRTRSVIVALDAPHTITADVDGDLRGRGTWTLTPTPGGGTHERFDWRVRAGRPLLAVLTPLLRPLFRWNHAWAIARAIDGLEPYAQRRAADGAAPDAVTAARLNVSHADLRPSR
jgi:uncharacterized protein YndB with AHSA1/START domain/mannose-6-phosphate isomerase-like protein (cupin superfamily)